MGNAGGAKDLRVQVTDKQVLQIAMPITLAILVPQINMLTNSIFLGRLSEEALGNAGITGVFYLIFAVAGNGLNNALQTVFASNAGSGNSQNFRIVLSQGIRICLQFAAAGILFTLFVAPYILKAVTEPSAYPAEMSFLRIRIFGLPFLYLFQMCNAFLVASLNSRLLMIGFIAEALINILFDYLLIYGHGGFPALGFNGAAYASVIAEISGLATVISVLVLARLKKEYGLFENLRFNKDFNRQILKVAVPLVLQYIISVATWLVFFLLLENRSAEAKAISNVMRNVFGLAGVFVWAFAATTNNMISNLIGQKREEDVIPAIKKIMKWSFLFCFVMVLLLNIFPTVFFSLFGRDESFVHGGVAVVRVVSAGIICMSISNVWLNSVTGTGKTKVNLVIEITAISFYLLYTLYFMKVNYISLPVAWSNEFSYWLTIFTMSFIYMRSGKWKGVSN